MPAFERPFLTPTDRDVLSREAVDVLRQAYDIGDWLAWQRTPKGSSNVSFFVTASSGRYVLRRSHSRKSVDAIRFESKPRQNFLVGLRDDVTITPPPQNRAH